MELMGFIDPLQKNCQMTNWKITRRLEKIVGKTHYFNGNLQELSLRIQVLSQRVLGFIVSEGGLEPRFGS